MEETVGARRRASESVFGAAVIIVMVVVAVLGTQAGAETVRHDDGRRRFAIQASQ